MAVIGGIMVPHPPLIVPEVGRGQEILIKDTIKAYQEAAGMAAQLKPDTIVVISPHAVMYADYFHVSPGKKAGETLASSWPRRQGKKPYMTKLS